jgi:hypothetical protein
MMTILYDPKALSREKFLPETHGRIDAVVRFRFADRGYRNNAVAPLFTKQRSLHATQLKISLHFDSGIL